MDALIDGVNALQARYPNASIVLAGHSLGGGLSAIGGQRMRVPSVSFSGPGSVLTGAKMGLAYAPAFYRGALVVVPDYDIVPRVDFNIGTIQHISCLGSTSAAECHSCHRTCCELMNSCGDPYGRRVLNCTAYLL